MDGSMFLPEFDHEFAETRRALERVPEDKFDWKPHEKSMTLGEHIQNAVTINVSEIDRNWLVSSREV